MAKEVLTLHKLGMIEVGSHATTQDTENHGAYHGYGVGATVGQVGVLHNQRGCACSKICPVKVTEAIPKFKGSLADPLKRA